MSGPERHRGLGRSWVALAFVVTSLVALVLVPYLMSRRVARVQREISQVLEPARKLGYELRFTQARARAALQGFLLSGDSRFRVRYRQAANREQQLLDSLSAISGSLELSVTRRLIEASDASFRWHLSHREVLDEQVPREGFVSELSREEEHYEEVQQATDRVLSAVSQEVEEGRRGMAEDRRRQLWITLGLFALALGATAAVAILGLRLSASIREAEKRKEDAVRARREADALLAATGDAVFGLDLQGRCTFLNRAGAELLGYSSSEVKGRKMHDLIHGRTADGEPHPEADCPAFRALERKEPQREPNQLIWRKDGSCFPAQFSARPMIDGLEVRGVVVTISDVTEAREQAEALRRAVRARDEVLAVVSHDLRNPVGSIYSAAGLLLDVPLPEDRRREHLEMIRQSARRASRLIQDLLDVTRIEAGHLQLDPGPVKVRELLGEALEDVRGRAAQKDVEIAVNVADEAAVVWGDRHRLLQAIGNLVDNAVKFSERGGRVEMRAHADEGTIQLEVEDEGPGIEPAEQGRLFDRFWRARRSDREGTGLGLAIVKGVVEAHGGSVIVESRLGEGALFRIRLPERGPGPGARKSRTSMDSGSTPVEH